MSLIHKQWIINDYWISSALMLVVSCVLGVMICSGKQRIAGQVVIDRTDPWCSDYTGISVSTFVSCSFWNIFIVLVVTNHVSRFCCDMFEVIVTMLYLVKTDSSNTFDCRCLSVLYKIEVIIQYCEINFTNLLVKSSTSVIILLLWYKVKKI